LTDIVRTAPAATPLIGQAADPAALTQALETLMHFGALMLRAGNAAFRVHQWMNQLARAMGIDALAIHIAIGGGITATARAEASTSPWRARSRRSASTPAASARSSTLPAKRARA